MKFIVQHVAKRGRIGCINEIDRLPGESWETPLLMMHTRGGSIPHLTHEVLQMVSSEHLFLHMPLTTNVTAIGSIAEYGRGISEFAGLKEYPTFVTPQDPAVCTPSGYNIKKDVAIWGRNGKHSICPTKYMEMMEKMKPDMYLALCDGDTNPTSCNKRITKCLERTSHMLEMCWDHHKNSSVLQKSALLAAVEGGYDLKARAKAALEVAQVPVSGYVIDGLHSNGPEVENINYSSISSVVKECLNVLPEDRLRVMNGAWSPETVLHLVADGIDVFDASLTYLLTEKGRALCFPFQETSKLNSSSASNGELGGKNGKNTYDINLNDEVFRDDFQAMLQDCTCLACRQHTRAYIHHLLKTKEMLAKVLIMIHNVHYYSEFFKEIRKAVRSNSLEHLQAIVKGS